MNLLQKFNISKQHLLTTVGTERYANLTVEAYLDLCGFDIDAFVVDVATCFDKSREHHHRLVYRDTMATCLGLDMNKPSDREKLWRWVAKEEGIDKKMRIKWNTGQVDPQLDVLDNYFPRFYDTHPECKDLPARDLVGPIRTGIARTLTYIRVFPPANPLCELPDAEMIPKDLQTCWDILRRHAHYRHHGNLNQHAIDSVADQFRQSSFWMDSSKIGLWKLKMEEPGDDNLPFWFWPWVIFKYATLKDRDESNKSSKKNPHRWIWNTQQNGRMEVWRLES